MWRALPLIVALASACGDDERAGRTDLDVALETLADDAADAVLETSAETSVEAEVVEEVIEEVVEEVVEEVADTAEDVPAETDATADASAPAWRWEAGPTLPAVVQENAVLAVGDAIWVLGGFQNLALLD